jgi:hypothetical protein
MKIQRTIHDEKEDRTRLTLSISTDINNLRSKKKSVKNRPEK